MLKVILIHGNNGCTASHFWLPYVKEQLEQLGIPVIARDFPDNDLARSSIWIPFLKNDLKADAETVVVGHSSGALCAMRFAEKYPLLGSVLVATYYTDLGIEKERSSGYFDSAWNWDAIRKNQKWIVQFASKDDPWIPIAEPRHVRDQLKTEYHEFADRGHFGGDKVMTEFKECVAVLKSKLKQRELNQVR